MNWIALLGLFAGSITVVSFVPQVIRVWRTRRTDDLSLSAFLLLASSTLLWLLYGLLSGDWPIILTNGVLLLLVLAILAGKRRFDNSSTDKPIGR